MFLINLYGATNAENKVLLLFDVPVSRAAVVEKYLADNNLPQGTGYDWTTISYQEKLVGNQAYFIYALSIILVFLVLAAQYESWFDPAAPGSL